MVLSVPPDDITIHIYRQDTDMNVAGAGMEKFSESSAGIFY